MRTCRFITLILTAFLLTLVAASSHAAFNFTTQPADSAAYTNATLELKATTQGSGNPKLPDGVRWYFNASSSVGLIAPGNLLTIAPPYSSTTASDTAQGQGYWTNILTISPTAPVNDGFYACVVTNGSFSITSSVATVTILPDSFDVLSLQLADPDPVIGGFQPLDSADSTGAFPAANWNSLEVDTPYEFPGEGRRTNWTEQMFALKDQAGIPTAAKLIVRGAGDAGRFENPQTNTAPIAKLMNTFIETWYRPVDTNVFDNYLGEGTMQLILTNLDNTKTYSVYVYLADVYLPGDSATGFGANIDAGTGVTNYTGYLPTSLPTAFAPSVNQINSNGTRDPGNHVRMIGIAPVNGAIVVTVTTWDPNWIGYGVGVSGIQLVVSSLDEVPPSITQQPASDTIYTGVTATFTVAALGAPIPTIQWYEIDGVVTNIIGGATGLSYTTPPAILGMSGREYFAVATNAKGSASSSAATLTVLAPAPDAGEVYSVQLAEPEVGGYQALSPTESTGAFPMTNWNAISVAVPGAGSGWIEQTFPLNDQYGVGSGVDLIVRGANDAWRFDDPPADNVARTKLMNTFIKTWYRPSQPEANEIGEGRMQLILTNLNDAETYNLYLYLADNDGYQADVDAGSGVINYAGDLPSSLPTFFTASTNQDEFGIRDPGNYVRQSGLTPTNGAITITIDYVDPDWAGFGAGVCGLQLVKESRDLFGPVIDPAPANQRVLTNTTATVLADALGWPLPTGFQWYEVVGGVTNLIPNATNQTYTTPVVTDATSGRGYILEATSPLGTVTSGIGYVTAGHLVGPVDALLQVDQYYDAGLEIIDILFNILDPSWTAINPPDNTLWIDTLEHQSALPDYSGERIYGWFTPPVTTNYVFFISADDQTLFLMSTDSNAANRCQIVMEEEWSADGNNWTVSGGGSSLTLKRSDQYVYNGALPGAAWPGGNTISLVAGNKYYVEVGHVQGEGGQSAAVTYKFEGEPDPANGTPTVITSNRLSTMSIPDNFVPSPVPAILDVAASGSDMTLSGGNGRVNGLYYVVYATDLSMPLDSWTVVETNFFDASGNFISTITRNPADPAGFYRVLSVQ